MSGNQMDQQKPINKYISDEFSLRAKSYNYLNISPSLDSNSYFLICGRLNDVMTMRIACRILDHLSIEDYIILFGNE